MPFTGIVPRCNAGCPRGQLSKRKKAPKIGAFTRLRLPKLFNLRTDCYERADVTSNTYYDYLQYHMYFLYAAQAAAQSSRRRSRIPPGAETRQASPSTMRCPR